MNEDQQLTFGFPRMRAEAGERRSFLPETIAHLTRYGAAVMLEHGYGEKMGYKDSDYLAAVASLKFSSQEEVYRQEYVVVLRCPSHETLRMIEPGACLISMLHFPTRPERTEFIHSLGIEGISLDSIKDDIGRRLVENLRAVAWNGIEAAFQALRDTLSSAVFESSTRNSIQVTLMGAGAVGAHVVQAAIQYGNPNARREYHERGIPGVQVHVLDYDSTSNQEIMKRVLRKTDILVDATQRQDPSEPVIPNHWISYMPKHAILLDLSVDPYNVDCTNTAVSVKGIEGIPQGNLDQYVFLPDDPAFDRLPPCIQVTHRRVVVSCYSWPGIHPIECMNVYGRQVQPILRTIIERGGIQNIDPEGRFFERAICRATLSTWLRNKNG